MKWEFHIDESGNAGDINPKIIDGKVRIEQPVFVLAAMGYPSNLRSDLEDYVKHVKSKYDVSNGELKAKLLYRSKPEVLIDIISYLRRNGLPIFIEINDKRYFIACKITDIIFRNARKEVDPQIVFDMSRLASDFICHEIDDALLYEFAQVSIARRPEPLRQWFDKMLNCLKQCTSIEGEMLYRNLKSVFIRYENESRSNETAYEQYLPDPDKNHRGEIVALLPHIPAIVSILQRIIKFTTDKEIADIRIVHDEQRQFESILLDNIKAMQDPELKNALALFNVKEIKKRRGLIIPENIRLEFGVSTDNMGIQIADLFSGTLMRMWSEYITGGIKRGNRFINVLREDLIPLESIHPSLGINFVVPNYDLDSFQKAFRI